MAEDDESEPECEEGLEPDDGPRRVGGVDEEMKDKVEQADIPLPDDDQTEKFMKGRLDAIERGDGLECKL
eukprot:6752581-Ditylum_brightwellii.AAC.1